MYIPKYKRNCHGILEGGGWQLNEDKSRRIADDIMLMETGCCANSNSSQHSETATAAHCLAYLLESLHFCLVFWNFINKIYEVLIKSTKENPLALLERVSNMCAIVSDKTFCLIDIFWWSSKMYFTKFKSFCCVLYILYTFSWYY